jgi:hypothetical protein
MSEELSVHRKMYDEAANMAAKSQILGLHQLDADGEIFRDSRGRILGSRSGDLHSDAILVVKFSRRKVLHKFKTIEAGNPVLVDVEFITYFVPGKERELINDRPVNDYDKWRFKKEYEAFSSGGAGDGTAISALSLSPGDISALNNNGIYTVEQLATISDDVCKVIPNVSDHRTAAERYLKTQVTASTKELQERLAAQGEQIEELKKMLAASLPDKKSGKKAGSEE